MGWSFAYDTSYNRERLIQDRIKPWSREDDKTTFTARVLKHSARGNTLWTVWEHSTTDKATGAVKVERFIGCDLMKGGGRSMGWGYKDQCESMGPCELDCPLSFLDMVPEPANNYGWRDKVRAYHAQGAKPKAKPGATIKLPAPIKFRDGVERDTFTIEKMPYRGKSRTYLRGPDGVFCRLAGWHRMDYRIL